MPAAKRSQDNEENGKGSASLLRLKNDVFSISKKCHEERINSKEDGRYHE